MNENRFQLTETFLNKYKRRKPPFGFNGLGELVYKRTYSRILKNGKNEEWWQTIQRVVEGTYNIQKEWIEQHRLEWIPQKAQFSAQEMYDRMYTMKILPGGRGLFAQGTDIIHKKKLSGALFNCSVTTTEFMKNDPMKPFMFGFDVLMQGIGLGADLKGAKTIVVRTPTEEVEDFVIPDSREGWVEALGLLIGSYFGKNKSPNFDYSEVRPAGALIKTFGGTASGAGPLKEMFKAMKDILNKNVDQLITQRTIADLFNWIGKTVVAGNTRRSAILLGGDDSTEFLDLKNLKVNPERESIYWASNNSVQATLGMDYSEIATRIRNNGEPGLLWIENAHNNKRMGDTSNGLQKDSRTVLTNPCGEIFLEGGHGEGELCNLVEAYLPHHDSLEDFFKSLKYAYLYGKTITLLNTGWAGTNAIMLRNRRIGTSVSGVAQFLINNKIDVLRTWLRKGYDVLKNYDDIYSNWLAIPKSIRITTQKPSGSTSLVTGCTPGIHYPESRFYIRRIQLDKNSPLIVPMQKAGYIIEPVKGQEDSTVVVEIPVDVGEGVRTLETVSMWEQLEMAAFMQEHWADNSVSVTITFDPETEGPFIEQALDIFQYKLKSVSFLPRLEKGAYAQMPYEKITEEKYNELIKNIKTLSFKTVRKNLAEIERFCSNDTCQI